jgi:small subunit ribosomal protein S13
MPRISGIDIPEKKITLIALTYIYGIGKKFSADILREANVEPNKRAKDLTADEVGRIAKIVERYNTEGNLRKTIRENIDRLKRIGAYRGLRHMMGLPVRGQRTRVNARTRRGKRKTIGALSKEDATKMEAAKK